MTENTPIVEAYSTIDDIAKQFGGLQKANGRFLAAILKTRNRIVIEKGEIEIRGGHSHLVVKAGENIKSRQRYRSYGPGTQVIMLL